jgi:hypothetical protein
MASLKQIFNDLYFYISIKKVQNSTKEKNTYILFNTQTGRDRMVVDIQLLVKSVPITTNVVSLNTIHGEVYSMQQ